MCERRVDECCDFAISFAGEDRDIAEKLVMGLKGRGFSVFYDRDFQAELYGRNLFDFLREKFLCGSRYVLCLISPAYAAKQWTNLELDAVKERLLENKFRSDFLIPILLDGGTWPRGISKNIGFKQLNSDENLEPFIEELTEKARSSTQLEAFTADVGSLIQQLKTDIQTRDEVNGINVDIDTGNAVIYKSGNSELVIRMEPGPASVLSCLQITASRDLHDAFQVESHFDLLVTWEVNRGTQYNVYDLLAQNLDEANKLGMSYHQLVDELRDWIMRAARRYNVSI